MKTMAKQQGFTIIELVVVILLLGILTATALPRFMDVTTQAHTAVVQGVQGSLQTSTSMFKAAWTAMGQPASDTAITAFGDGSLRVNAVGYPKGNATTGITNDASGASECAVIYSELLEAGGTTPTINPSGLAAVPTAAQLNSDNNDFLAYVTGADICNFAYAEEAVVAGGTARVITYNSLTGTITLGVTAALQ
jgi:MSHA pilin protein MshB